MAEAITKKESDRLLARMLAAIPKPASASGSASSSGESSKALTEVQYHAMTETVTRLWDERADILHLSACLAKEVKAMRSKVKGGDSWAKVPM